MSSWCKGPIIGLWSISTNVKETGLISVQQPQDYISHAACLTLAAFLSPSVRTPSSLLSRKYEISSSVKISGSAPTAPSTWPTIRSARHSVGSILVPTPARQQFTLDHWREWSDDVFLNNKSENEWMLMLPIRPPGAAYCRSLCSANNETILEKMGLHISFPSWSLETIPGRTSISWPTWRHTEGTGQTWVGQCVVFGCDVSKTLMFSIGPRHQSLMLQTQTKSFCHCVNSRY